MNASIVRLAILWLLVPLCTHAQNFSGPVPPPASGYGAWGSSAVDSVEFYNAVDPTGDTSVIYFPQNISAAQPTVFYLHGIGGNSAAQVRELLHFTASKGFTCVFVPWDNSMQVLMAYAVMYNGFLQAARSYPNLIDTTRVGFVGHSFGGGACYSLAYSLAQLNWGNNARFLMPVAQWYTHAITQTELQAYPSQTFLLSILFDDDIVCDHRMSVDIFRTISIPAADKDLVRVSSSQYQSYAYSANHTAVQTTVYDAIDAYVIFRLLDAMMDFVFNQNTAAKTTCLGDGSAAQTTMPPGLNPLLVSDTLSVWYPESQYGYPCSSQSNPRWMYCDVSLFIVATSSSAYFVVMQTQQLMIMHAETGSAYFIRDARGALVRSGIVQSDATSVDLNGLSEGMYVVTCSNTVFRFLHF